VKTGSTNFKGSLGFLLAVELLIGFDPFFGSDAATLLACD
jgi:hypothetical protein